MGITFDETEQGSRFEVVDIPRRSWIRRRRRARTWWRRARTKDDRVMALYLDGKEPSEEELRAATAEGLHRPEAVPGAMRVSLQAQGVQPLLDAVVDYLPSPLDIPPVHGKTRRPGRPHPRDQRHAPFSALAFKIMTDPSWGR
jgi:elongation factor G